MTDELPQGWTTIPLREVVVARKGKKPKVLHEIEAPKRVPYLLIDQMEGRPPRYFTDDPKVTVASKHDVLVVWDGSIGKCATGLEGAVGSTIVALKPMGVASGFLEAFQPSPPACGRGQARSVSSQVSLGAPRLRRAGARAGRDGRGGASPRRCARRQGV